MKLKTISNLNLRNKTVLLRVNFDVPIKNGRVVDDSRILAHLPTINFILKAGAKLILISHLGRPSKEKNQELRIRNYGLKPVFNNLKFKIENLKFIESLNEKEIKKEVEKMKAGDIVLLENLRFWDGEEKNDNNFAKFLASLADAYPVRSSSRDGRDRKKELSQTSNGVYVNDAFAVSHRNHASVSAITKYLPSYAGLLLEREVTNLSQILIHPNKPFIVLMGGAKISTKMPVLKMLARQADQILVGGALANDLLKAEGYQVGESLVEQEITKISPEIKKKIILPIDVKIKFNIKNKKTQIKNIKIDELEEFIRNSFKFVISRRTGRGLPTFKILDIGEETVKLFADYLKNAKMIIWNGPMGLFEEKPFGEGTRKLVKSIISNKKAKIIIGGGDTITCLRQSQTNAERTQTNLPAQAGADGQRKSASSPRKSASMFVSTGGGAMLEFLSGKMLPGIRGLLSK